MITAFAFALPWIGLVLFALLVVRLPPELPRVEADDGAVAPPVAGSAAARPGGGDERTDGAPRAVTGPPGAERGTADRAGAHACPLVTVVVPARNEAHNIGRVLESLSRSTYPRFEIVVVDDRSDDDTAAIARAVARGHAERIEVVRGRPLPEGWLGKPWACHQGARVARGELLLFTDADTIHQPGLLNRAVVALRGDGAHLVTVAGRQLMGSFWERLVQPQVFTAMVFRYFDRSEPLPAERWRAAIANGQYILFDRAAYEAFGGHEAVRGEVVEDLRIAQRMVREGWELRLYRAEDDFATRMYRSLGELVAGWSKNLMLGGLQTYRPLLRPFIPPLMILSSITFWLLPPAVLALATAGALGPRWLAWAALCVAVSVAFWAAVTHRFGAPWYYGLLYPLGAAATLWIFVKSWIGMRDVRWKGRAYRAALPGD